MRRLRPSQWSGQMLQARSGATSCIAASRRPLFLETPSASRRCQSTLAAEVHDFEDAAIADSSTQQPLPSPHPSRASQSAKLAALHARLSLSPKIPVQTLARSLVHPTADPNTSFNNENLAYLGTTLINYHVLEYLICKWPRLPMPILYEALRAYGGPEALWRVARGWGVEAAATPGEEVDPGLLQWSDKGVKGVTPNKLGSAGGYARADRMDYFRRGWSSRVVLDNDFGDKNVDPVIGQTSFEVLQQESYASVVKSVIGAVYSHCGREAAKAFVDAHVVSRHVDLAPLFGFEMPTRELSLLCQREGFEPPVARLESETGRHSRTPVFIVGVYSGKEKMGEGVGPSLNVARKTAAMNALKAWYLYSPGNNVRVPSAMFEQDAKPWKAPYIDIGEVLT